MSTNKCLNCEQTFSPLQFILHSRICEKNIKKCPTCNELIIIDEYDEHIEEAHIKVNCSQCGKLIERIKLNDHMEVCSKKLIPCVYCGLFLDKHSKHDHEHICGSITEECIFCHQMVPRKEKELHEEYKCIGVNRAKKIQSKFTDETQTKSIDEILKETIKDNEEIKIKDNCNNNNNTNNSKENIPIIFDDENEIDEWLEENQKNKDYEKSMNDIFNKFNPNGNNLKQRKYKGINYKSKKPVAKKKKKH